VPDSRRAELLAFLDEAVPFYEGPLGVRVGLYESVDEPGLFLELVAYAGERAYIDDQARVEHDAAMGAMLTRFRAVVAGPVEVRRMKPVEVPSRAPGAVRIERAAFNDHAAIAQLLASASLPVPVADEAPVHMLVARELGRLAGCAGWESHGDTALLRSVAVDASERRKGLGRALVRGALVVIAAAGVRQVTLLTESAEAFFAGLGFTRIDRSELPIAVRGSRQVASSCCAGATAMRRELSG
jgi:amino-acid N-acetyltransferase